MNTERMIEIAKRNLLLGVLYEAGIEPPSEDIEQMAEYALQSEDMNRRLEARVVQMVEGPFGSLALVQIEDLPKGDNVVGYLHAIRDLMNVDLTLVGDTSEDFTQGFNQGVSSVLQAAAMLAESIQCGSAGEELTAKLPLTLN